MTIEFILRAIDLYRLILEREKVKSDIACGFKARLSNPQNFCYVGRPGDVNKSFTMTCTVSHHGVTEKMNVALQQKYMNMYYCTATPYQQAEDQH